MISINSLLDEDRLPPISSTPNSCSEFMNPEINCSRNSSSSLSENPTDARINLETPPIAPISLTDTATAFLASSQGVIKDLVKCTSSTCESVVESTSLSESNLTAAASSPIPSSTPLDVL